MIDRETIARVRTAVEKAMKNSDHSCMAWRDDDILALCDLAEAQLPEPADAPWPICKPERHHWVNMDGGGQRCAACKITRDEPADPPADMVETVARALIVFDRGEDVERQWPYATPEARAVIAALRPWLLQPGMVAVPAETFRTLRHWRKETQDCPDD